MNDEQKYVNNRILVVALEEHKMIVEEKLNNKMVGRVAVMVQLKNKVVVV